MKIIAFLGGLLAFFATFAYADTMISFGYLRMAGLDSPHTLTGFLIAINDANTKNLYPGLKFRLNVTTIPCMSPRNCANISAADDAKYVQTFLNSMSQFTAVFKPNYFIAVRVIDRAAELGGVPVIDPGTIRSRDYAFDPMTWLNASMTAPSLATQVNNSQHIVNFRQHIRGSLVHVYTFMQQNSGCSYSGIIYEPISEMSLHVAFVQSLFNYGGLPKPPALNVVTATDEELVDFFISDARRTCFVVLTTHATFLDTVSRLVQNTYFDPSENHFYGSRLMADDYFSISPTVTLQNPSARKKTPYSVAVSSDDAMAYTYFVQWFPSVVDSTLPAAAALAAAFTPWRSTFNNTNYNDNVNGWPYVDDANSIDYVPVNVLDSTFECFMIMNYVLEGLNTAKARLGETAVESAAAAGSPTPIPWSSLIAAFFSDGPVVGGYPFFRAIRNCPPVPMKQLCYCNTVTRTSYLYRVAPKIHVFPLPDGNGGIFNLTLLINTPYMLFDNINDAQRNVATLEFPTSCTYELSSWSFPVTATVFYEYPSAAANGLSQAQADIGGYITDRVYREYAYTLNYAAVAPPRPFRFGGVIIRPGEDLQTSMSYNIDRYSPFINAGTAGSIVAKSSGTTLTLVPSLTYIQTEDPILVPHSQWRWEMINVIPVLADHIHALASYYSDEMGTSGLGTPGVISSKGTSDVTSAPYTAIRSLATSQREAELIALSLQTFGNEYYASNTVISTDPAVWSAKVTQWLAETSNPFILVASTNNTNNCMYGAYQAAASITRYSATPLTTVNRGIVAFATSEEIVNYFHTLTPLSDLSTYTSTTEIIFASFMEEWWTQDMKETVAAAQQSMSYHPTFWKSKVQMDFINSLVQQVQYDYSTTAAAMLYNRAYVSGDQASFGPFYNTTCSNYEVATNEKDRRCQCTKGIRNMFVYSVHNWDRLQLSTRTGQYAFSLTTCGAKYYGYVPPEAAKSLSAGAIAGIAVGCSVAFLAVIGGIMVYFVFFTGRNNRAAPKDPSMPFAIVFTDIQSSTALWARTPAAMSEAVDQHHRIMRKVLRRNHGYEVKTVGDSFMVAFKDPNDAVTFALEVQAEFNNASWSDEIDATYIELLAEAGVVETYSYGQSNVNDGESVGSMPNNGASGTDAAAAFNAGRSQHSTFASALALAQSSDANNDLNTTHSTGSPAPTDALEKPKMSVVTRPSIAVSTSDDHSGDFRTRRTVKRKNFVNPWHGVRVRIGVHFGMGDIRKDPVSLGYDYYGTVVNTAARVEGVGHGGQILVTEAAYEALDDSYARNNSATVIALGPQPLRGLDVPIKLYQFVPASLEARRFPTLRLHIEKEDNDSSAGDINSTNNSGYTSSNPVDLATRLCETKQFKGHVTPQELMQTFAVLEATFAPLSEKFRRNLGIKICESWGFEKADKEGKNDKKRMGMMVQAVGKITKTLKANQLKAQRDLEAGHLNALLNGGGSSIRSHLTTVSAFPASNTPGNNNVSTFNHGALSTRSEGGVTDGANADITIFAAGKDANANSTYNFHPDSESAVGGTSGFGTSVDRAPMPIGVGRGSAINSSPHMLMGSGSIFNSNLHNPNGSASGAQRTGMNTSPHLTVQKIPSSNCNQSHQKAFRTGSGDTLNSHPRESIDVLDAGSAANSQLPQLVGN